jgi:hypothetical protein
MEQVRSNTDEGTKVHIPSQIIQQHRELVDNNLTGLKLADFMRSAFDEKRSRLLVRGLNNAE